MSIAAAIDLGKWGVFDPGVFSRFDLAALLQPHLQGLCMFVCLFVCLTLLGPLHYAG